MRNLSRTPVSVEEALDLRSSMNVTNEAFDMFLKFISGKWGDESLSKGTKVNYCQARGPEITLSRSTFKFN